MSLCFPKAEKFVSRVLLVRLFLGVLGGVLVGILGSGSAHAAGTPAGASVLNRADIVYRVNGSSTTQSRQTQIQTFVDELLEVSIVSDDGAFVPVNSPQGEAVLQFTLTNLGNGQEPFRLVADVALAGDDFDALTPLIYLESNGIAGLQTGAGGDTAYVGAANDPVLAADEVRIAYVSVAVPAGRAALDVSRVELRAVANTIVTNAGTDDPRAPNFPAVATSYASAGDVLDGPAVTAVVGNSYDSANPLLADIGQLQVSAALLQIEKSVIAVTDPGGGSSVVPGALVTYEISVFVAGATDAENVVITDPIPTDLAYQPGTLVVSGLAPGQEADDDFEPTGLDDTGFNEPNGVLQAVIGTVIAGASPITVRFQAAVR